MLVDSHCHLDDYADLAAVLQRAHAADIGQVLAVGIGNGPHEMHRALEISRELTREHTGGAHVPEVFASAGIHPQEAHQATPEALDKLRALAADPRCIAVGEVGLDYYHADNPEIPVQQAAFVAQMQIAAAARKPILIHCRTSELARPDAKLKFETGSPNAAWDDLLALIGEHWTPTRLAGIMHCFSGNADDAQRSLEADFYLSFAGNLTYPKSTAIQQVAKDAPANRILVETDAPFLAPLPLRGQENEPAHVVHTATYLAELRGVYLADIARQTTDNFHALFPFTASPQTAY